MAEPTSPKGLQFRIRVNDGADQQGQAKLTIADYRRLMKLLNLTETMRVKTLRIVEFREACQQTLQTIGE